jgi:hypothetical protein
MRICTPAWFRFSDHLAADIEEAYIRGRYAHAGNEPTQEVPLLTGQRLIIGAEAISLG